MSKADVRIAVSRRAQGSCEYCKSQQYYSPDSFSVEHIIPRSKHGNDDESNLAFSCQGCNNYKFISTSGLDPLTGEIAPLFNPRSQKWRDHFAWTHDKSRILGLTPTGRATVSKLKLNREGAVNMRKILNPIAKRHD